MSQERFNRLVNVYRSVVLTPGSRQGVLTITTDALLQDLRVVASSEREYGVLLIGNPNLDSLRTGEVHQVQLDEPRIGIGILADSFDEILTFQNGYIREPRFFLLPLMWACTDNAPPELVSRYRTVISLIKIFEESSAYLDKEDQQLVYIDEGKFVLPVAYRSDDLNKLDLASANALLERFGHNTHRDQKLTILARATQKLCGQLHPSDRFSYLLRQISELLNKFDEGYRIYVADFSYEKVLDQMEAAKLEELAKIHKNFSDIQNQILGIPVATVIVATQLKSSSNVGVEFWVNTAILIGVWIFAILTNLVLRNQRNSLDAISDEILRKKKKLESDYSEIKDAVGGIFPQLEKRLRNQRIAFRAVDFVVVVGIVLAHIMYFVMTEPAKVYLLKSVKMGIALVCGN
ncbi:hypothetical protein WCD99_04140 [Pseudomonas paraeruginosa]|uniref:hypothetical protein n=1 Tax=Pseudomonas paraeruginosa TaxID=2994495 RepID=UPI0034D6B632